MTDTALRLAATVLFGFALVPTALAERAAVVYSRHDASLAYSYEFDKTFEALGWTGERIENARLGELVGRLGEFSAVFVSTMGNYVKPADIRPDREKWLRWLRAGGVLVVVDANYACVVDDLVGALGPEFACHAETCSANRLKTPESRKLTLGDDGILVSPHPLGRLMRERDAHWAHVTNLAPGWKVPVSCVDGAALLAYREVGRGVVVLATPANLRHNPVGKALVANVMAAQRRRAAGVEILSFEGDDASAGVGCGCRVRLKVDRGRARALKARFAVRAESGTNVLARAGTEASAAVGGDGIVEFAPKCAIPRKGTLCCVLVVSDGEDEVARFRWENAIPPPVELAVRRKHLYPGDDLSLAVRLHPARGADGTPTGFAWRIDGGAWTRRPVTDGEWTVPLGGLPVGRHELVLRTEDAAGRSDPDGEATAEFFTHSEPKYRFRADRTLLENGKPFFPLGFYYVSWSKSDAERLEMAENIASWGYNAVHVGIRGSDATTDGYGTFLDACARLGLRVITEFGLDHRETVLRYRGKPAVMGWNPGDEPALNGIGPAEMFSRYDQLKRLDPDHIAYTVIASPSCYAAYAPGTDVVAPDPYPVPQPGVRNAFDCLSEAQTAAARVDTAVWSVCQAFGGQGYSSGTSYSRVPTPREFRALQYLALMAGVKGIVNYVYYDSNFDLLKEPELLDAVKAFPREARDVIPFALDGRLARVDQPDGAVLAATWTLGARRLFVAVNTGSAECAAKAPFAGEICHGRAIGGTTVDGAFRFRLAPLERIVIRSTASLPIGPFEVSRD